MFNSALCLGTLVLRDPGNIMANFVLTQIDAAISLFTSLVQHGARTPRYKSNLQWLLNLRTRALSKLSEASVAPGGLPQRHDALQQQSTVRDGDGNGEQDEDVELLGWRTRLIERAGQGRQKTIRTIRLVETPTGSQTTEAGDLPPTEPQFQGFTSERDLVPPSGSLSAAVLDSTNDLVSSH